MRNPLPQLLSLPFRHREHCFRSREHLFRKTQKVFTFNRNNRSSSTEISVHVEPEWVFTIDRNTQVIALLRRLRPVPREARTSISKPPFPVYLLRATRDEASMVLSVAQGFDWLCATLARLHDPSEISIRQPLTLLGYAFMYAICLIAGLEAVTAVSNVLGLNVPHTTTAALAALVYAPAAAGATYVVGHALLAMAAGHHNIARLLTTAVEVDAAPPGVMCSLIVYSDLARSPSKTLRHGLYECEAVIREVAALVTQVSSDDRSLADASSRGTA